MNFRQAVYIVCVLFAVWCNIRAFAQDDDFSRDIRNRVDQLGRPLRKDTGDQKLQHRDPLEDSITINYHYFDSGRTYKLDSSINDFYTRYPISYLYTDMGNFGNAARSLIFSPFMRAGWDAGFHAYDVYKFTPENTKIYSTTRPYTELAYMLGSKSEQYIDVLHTQSRKNNINFGFEYRLINAPGAFKNSNSSNNNIRVSLSYVSKNKRYGIILLNLSNSMKSSDNGGVQEDSSVNGLTFNDPFVVPVRLGNASSFSRNFFSTTINTGTIYKSNQFILRQNYDLGQADSLVADTITYRLFYPRIRFQYTIDYQKQDYQFKDIYPVDSLYRRYYNYVIPGKTLLYRDLWHKLTNDFSIISFPEKNNLNQFLKLGAGYEIISGGYYPYVTKYNNIYFTGEYRNRTRNKKWDFQLSGRLYGAGDYGGDYEASISIERLLNNNRGSLLAGFKNVNRAPSSVFSSGVSAFPMITDAANFNKQNISRAYASLSFTALDLVLEGDYYIVSNYIYLDDFFKAHQQSALFNLLHIAADKKIKLARYWNWYIEVHLQQEAGNPPVNVPLLFTRNRFAFEGNFFKNLFISTGFEVRYNTPYNADNYSPFNGQFMYQDTFSTKNNRPDINAFLNIRIKSFKAFVRAENLNAFNPDDQYRFTFYNYSAPHYPQRPFWFRFGFWWNFVN